MFCTSTHHTERLLRGGLKLVFCCVVVRVRLRWKESLLCPRCCALSQSSKLAEPHGWVDAGAGTTHCSTSLVLFSHVKVLRHIIPAEKCFAIGLNLLNNPKILSRELEIKGICRLFFI